MSEIKLLEHDFEIVFQHKIYSLDTIKKAAYKFARHGSSEIVSRDDSYHLYFKMASGGSPEFADELVQLIKSEVLDQDLREIVRKETESVRILLLANAFSNTKLVQQ